MPPMVTAGLLRRGILDFVTKSTRFKPSHTASGTFLIDILLQCSKITVYL